MTAASNVLPYGARGSAVDPERARVPGADTRVRAIVLRQLPRLDELVVDMRQRVAGANCPVLEATLRTHMAVAGALRFELLVSPGLRARPSESDEAAFHRQVAAVSESTEGTWLAIKRFLEQRAVDSAESEAIASEFAMEFRALYRRVSEEAASADALQAHLAARAGVSPGGSPRKALDDLVMRNVTVRDALAQLGALCEAARPAQGVAYRLAEGQAELRESLRKLATRLGGGLLERLRVLVVGDVAAPADELRSAQAARAQLIEALEAALRDLTRVQGASEELVAGLDAIAHRSAAMQSTARAS